MQNVKRLTFIMGLHADTHSRPTTCILDQKLVVKYPDCYVYETKKSHRSMIKTIDLSRYHTHAHDSNNEP